MCAWTVALMLYALSDLPRGAARVRSPWSELGGVPRAKSHCSSSSGRPKDRAALDEVEERFASVVPTLHVRVSYTLYE